MKQRAKRALRDIGQKGGDSWFERVALHMRKPATDEEIARSGWQR